MTLEFPIVSIFGIPVAAWRLEDLLKWVDFHLQGDRTGPKKVMYANVHTLNLACQDPVFHWVLRGADVVYCDGSGVRFGARLLKRDIPERMTGADWIYDLCALAEQREYRLFLLGGSRGIAEQAVARLKNRFPRLLIAGTHHGYFHRNARQQDALLAHLRATDIDILLVGMGSPLQELWIQSRISQLPIPIVWAMGAAMDFVAQVVPRAPGWMCNYHLEWLFRLKTEPRRLWSRYTLGNLKFLIRILGNNRWRSREVWGRAT